MFFIKWKKYLATHWESNIAIILAQNVKYTLHIDKIYEIENFRAYFYNFICRKNTSTKGRNQQGDRCDIIKTHNKEKLIPKINWTICNISVFLRLIHLN